MYIRIASLLVVGLLLRADPSGAQVVTVTKASPTEAKLAMIDGGSVRVNQSLVKQYGLMLDTLDARCAEDRTKIADMAVRSTQLIKEKSGKTVKIRSFLEGAIEATREVRDVECVSILATLAVLLQAQ